MDSQTPNYARKRIRRRGIADMASREMKLRKLYFLACGCLLMVSVARSSEPEVAFLRERVSVTTRRGVTGFPPGSRVIIISRHGPRCTVKADNQQFEVSQDQLIGDSEAARSLSARDAADQQAAQREIAQRQAVERAPQQQPRALPPPPDPKAPLKAQLKKIEDQRRELEAELERVQEERKEA